MWRKRNGGINTLEQYISSKHNKSVSDFLKEEKNYELRHITEAVKFIKKYQKEGKIFFLITDYDVDGIMSMGILKIGLERYGCKVICRIPKRQSEGYGIRESIIDEIPENAVIITADNGISEYNSLKKASKRKIPCLITDHHLPPVGNMPPADVIVNPRIYKGTFEFYCGAAIVYKIMEKLFPNGDVVLPLLKAYAAIATIADRMPIIEDNRLIVKDGLEILKENKGKITTGLKAIKAVLGISDNISADTVAFQIAPLLNAAGRLEDDGAVKSFQTIIFNGSEDAALQMAEELHAINEERKKIVANCMEQIQLPEKITYPIMVYQENVPEGIIGLIAAKLQETYKGPAFVFTNIEDGKMKGSARSNEVHIKHLMDNFNDLFVSYGGHEGAGGMTITAENFQILSDKMTEHLSDFKPDFNDYYDIEIDIKELKNVLKDLQKFEPFGYGNELPIFRISNLSVTDNYRIIGKTKEHLKIQCDDEVSILCFKMAEDFLRCKSNKNNVTFEDLLRSEDKLKDVSINLDFMGILEYNHFNGNTYAQMNAQKMQTHEEKKGTLLEKLKNKKEEKEKKL